MRNLWALYLDAAPWLVLGLVAAGLIKAWLPESKLSRWLGGKGIWPVVKSALLGAPLPLCSCGVLPAALGLHRAGASKGSTLSFLIATPETGPDSIAISYALLGPFMAVLRPIAAIFSAIFTGILAWFVEPHKSSAAIPLPVESSPCKTNCCNQPASYQNGWKKTWDGQRYAFGSILYELSSWLAIGLILAALVATWIPPLAMAEWGSGLEAKLLMLLVGIPMYVCATASTPIAAGLLLAGISPGTVLVFLLAGPATNIATISVIGKELGWPSLGAYLCGIALSSLGFGMLTDKLVEHFDVDILAQLGESSDTLPETFAIVCGIFLLIMAIKGRLQKS